MSLAAVGSIAFDSVETPFGRAERELGGSATYAAIAAAYFTEVRVVGPVGDDFGSAERAFLEGAGVNTRGIDAVPGGSTFSWRGRYDFDMAVAHSEELALNVFADWQPHLTPSARKADVLFLAAMDPATQLDVRRQWDGAKWCALDTQAYWIETKRDALVEAISEVDIVLMNDQEARALTRTPVLLQAARTIVAWGPRVVVLKLGEYGCALLTEDGYFSLPGYPLEELSDPSGSGDAFAGAFLGDLDLVPRSALTEEAVRRAVTYGSVMASFCVEDFGPRRLVGRSQHEVRYRFDEFLRMTHFEHVPTVPHPHEAGVERPAALERPAPTAGTRGIAAPPPTAATPAYRSPGRTPSNQQFDVPNRPPPELFR